VSKFIVDNIGGTEFGPAASFRDIVRAIADNTHEILSVSTPRRFSDIQETVFVGIPLHLGTTIETSVYDSLSKDEQEGINEAARAIYQTYKTAIDNIE
jgi:malate/lactate dehydrogenase